VFAVVFFLIAAALLVPAVASIFMPLFWFAAKTGFLLFVWIWIRGTLPRFRYDQLMGFAWKFLFPVSVLNLLATGLMVALFS
jgi:NADH-quinone oxidoreductase subunit H